MTWCVFDFFIFIVHNVSSTGPAQVPMMSPNGSVPQIYVPPGYVQQVSHYRTSFILFLWELLFLFGEKDAIFSLIYIGPFPNHLSVLSSSVFWHHRHCQSEGCC